MYCKDHSQCFWDEWHIDTPSLARTGYMPSLWKPIIAWQMCDMLAQMPVHVPTSYWNWAPG